MNTFTYVPPGFRFHPTDEELVDYYLRKKINSRRIDLDVIKDVDLYKIEPWDLQELCRIGAEEQNEWYFFSHKDKKYPTGTRTNRATAAGFWKATGRDKAIYSKHDLIGMRKTLVFYKGRAPNGQKSDWIMHEYRLETDENATPQEEGWVVCRVFKKRIAATTSNSMRKVSEHESPINWYDDHVSFMATDMDSPNHHSQSNLTYQYPPYSPNSNKKDINLLYQIQPPDHHHQHHFLQLPLLESPKQLLPPAATIACSGSNSLPTTYGINMITNASGFQSSSAALTVQEHMHQAQQQQALNSVLISNDLDSHHDEQEAVDDQVMTTDWRVLDKFVASQLSQEEASKVEVNYNYNSNNATNTFPSASADHDDSNNLMVKQLEKQEMAASTSSSSCQIDLWK